MTDQLPGQWAHEDAHALMNFLLGEVAQYGVLFYDADLRITGWSAGAIAITGWRADEVIGQPISLLFVPEDVAIRLPEHEANTAIIVGAAENERWHVRRDGSWFWSSGISFPLRREAGRVTAFVKIFRDATHLRARTKALENTVQDYREREEEHARFIGTIAHELRNPVAPIRTAVELMKRGATQQEVVAKSVAIIDRQVAFQTRLIEDLVDLTRVQTGKMRIDYSSIALQAYLGELLEPVQAAVAEKGIAFHLVQPSVPICVEADPQRLQQVILNLVNNAAKFTPGGGTIWLTVTVDQTHFILYVKDTGRGMAPEILPRIFDVFTQAPAATTERGAGLGIGLAVVKEIVSLHEGTIEVRSDGLGKGCEFTVRIPRQRPHGAEPEPIARPAPGE